MVGWHQWLSRQEFEQTQEIVKDWEAWHAAVHQVAKSGTQLSNWTTTTKNVFGILHLLANSLHFFICLLQNIITFPRKGLLRLCCKLLILSRKNCTFQDSVPGYQVDLFNMETTERGSHGEEWVQNSSHRESSWTTAGLCSLPFLGQLGLGTSSSRALKTRLSTTQARTHCQEIPGSATGRALVLV